MYCPSKSLCEALAEALGCMYYHADVLDCAERIQQWLKDGGLVVAILALGTGVNYPRIVFILHVGMLWSMTDYAQESGRSRRAGERLDLVVLLEPDEVEWMMERKSTDMDVQAMGRFLIGSGC